MTAFKNKVLDKLESLRLEILAWEENDSLESAATFSFAPTLNGERIEIDGIGIFKSRKEAKKALATLIPFNIVYGSKIVADIFKTANLFGIKRTNRDGLAISMETNNGCWAICKLSTMTVDIDGVPSKVKTVKRSLMAELLMKLNIFGIEVIRNETV